MIRSGKDGAAPAFLSFAVGVALFEVSLDEPIMKTQEPGLEEERARRTIDCGASKPPTTPTWPQYRDQMA